MLSLKVAMEEVLGIKDLYIEDVAGFEKNVINKKKENIVFSIPIY